MSQLIKKSPTFPNLTHWFEDFLTNDFFDWNEKNFAKLGTTLPSVNLKENDKSYHFEMAAPGLKKDDFQIDIHQGVLSVKAEKKEEIEEKDEKYLRREFKYERFYRSFNLPENINEDSIKATYHDGLLKISIDKKEVKPVINKKSIEVK